MSTSAVTTVTQHRSITESREARLAAAGNVLSYAILAGGIATIVAAVYVVVLGHSHLPYWDEWMQIDFAANEGRGYTLDWLWRQFNQHRVVIPKLFLLADLRWFHATQISLLVSNLVLQFLHLSLLSWSMRVVGGWRGALWRTAVGLLAFCLFCPSQWPNFLMGFTGLCCQLLPFFASAAFLGLLLYWRKSQDNPKGWAGKYLLLAVAAALCATFSLSNGNLIWPLLVIGALLLRRPGAAITVTAVAAAGIFAFFYHYTVYLTPKQLDSSGELMGLVRYIAVYFGSSWVTSSLRLAEVLGVAGFLLLAFTLWQLRSYFKVSPPICIQFGLLLFFVLGTGIITAPGRVVFGLDQAFSGRYQSFALLFWGCMAVLLLGRLTSLRPEGGLVVLSQAAILAVMVFAAGKTPPLLAKVRWHGFNVNAAAVALETEVPDKDQLVWADSHPDYARSLAAFMREERLSVFAGPEPFLLGRSLQSEFNLRPSGECVGGVESVKAITTPWPRALRIEGWAWVLQGRRPPSSIVLATQGTITGLGIVGDRRGQKEVAGQTTSDYTGFTAYIRDVSRTDQVDVYAVWGGESACRIANVNPE